VTLATTNAAIATRYDAIPYATIPHPLTHPDRIASVARFLGLAPPQVAHARVLEVGCGDGANLIPMAATLPSARFVGCDLSSRALAAGRATIGALRLSNVELVEEDLRSLAPAHGDFDFIIAHGVYSWVPAEVRDGLLALAAARLAPNGLMFVSFNALPGTRVRQVAWEVLHRHVDQIEDPRERLAAARDLAATIAAGRSFHPSDDAVRAEFRAIAQSGDSELCHDTLSVPNDPVYFREFSAHAGRFGLRYLAEADLHSMSAAGLTPEARQRLSTLDPTTREEYLDFVRLRRFRQSLLCRTDAPSDPAPLSARLDAMHASADRSLLQAIAGGKLEDIVRQFDPAHAGGGPVRALLEAIAQHAPAAIALRSLREQIGQQPLPKPFDALVADAYVSNFTVLHTQPPAVVAVAGEHPVAGALARLEAASREELTSLLHVRVRIPDVNARRLVTLLDGTRDRGALVAEINGPAFAYQRDAAKAFVDRALAQLARHGLLAA
jgi:SAM-dependent methyltransferase